MRRIVLLAAAAAVAGAVPARAAQVPLESQLARALTVPHVSAARSAAVAVDLSSGKPLFVRNGSLALVPASNEKLAVTYAALDVLGPEYRIETTVLGEGEQQDAVWEGDLVLQGHGDPTLTSASLRALAAQIWSAGIRRVSGAVFGDEGYFDARRIAPGWKPSYYMGESPPLSALAVDRGRYGNHVSPRPALAAAYLFAAALRARGIGIVGGAGARAARPEAEPLATVLSPPLTTILTHMDRESDNFTAELLLKGLGAAVLDEGTTAAGAQVVTQELAAAGVPMAGVVIVDGSGLSRLDRLTANALVALLRVSWADQEVRAALVHALPVAGVSGTLDHRLRRAPARGNVYAKTGTTDVASALSGFVRDRYAFAVIQNGAPVSWYWARRAQDRFALVLASQ